MAGPTAWELKEDLKDCGPQFVGIGALSVLYELYFKWVCII